MIDESLYEAVADYLDGRLDADAKRAFEHALIDPELQQALALELTLRDLMAELPPHEAPEYLVARIEQALGVEQGRGQAMELVQEALRRWGRLTSLGPGIAFDGLRVATAGADLGRLVQREQAAPAPKTLLSPLRSLEQSAHRVSGLQKNWQQARRLLAWSSRLVPSANKERRSWWQRLLGR